MSTCSYWSWKAHSRFSVGCFTRRGGGVCSVGKGRGVCGAGGGEGFAAPDGGFVVGRSYNEGMVAAVLRRGGQASGQAGSVTAGETVGGSYRDAACSGPLVQMEKKGLRCPPKRRRFDTLKIK